MAAVKAVVKVSIVAMMANTLITKFWRSVLPLRAGMQFRIALSAFSAYWASFC